MKLEITEALALELTKAIIADQDPLSHNTTSAEHWVKTYNESLAKIKAEVDKGRKHQKPMTGGSTVFD